jgi:hypothetical protein
VYRQFNGCPDVPANSLRSFVSRSFDTSSSDVCGELTKKHGNRLQFALCAHVAVSVNVRRISCVGMFVRALGGISMLYFNSCPRCKTGTVKLDSDFYGSFLSCLNCGFEKSAASVRKLAFDESETASFAEPVLALVDDSYSSDDDDDDFEDDFDDEDVAELERAVS